MTTQNTLTRVQLRELEAELHGERARLERLMEDHAIARAPAAAIDGHGDGGSEVYAAAGVQTRTDARYDSIVAALERLAAGTYGICTGCAQAIPYGRLIVMPEATSCVACPRS